MSKQNPPNPQLSRRSFALKAAAGTLGAIAAGAAIAQEAAAPASAPAPVAPPAPAPKPAVQTASKTTTTLVFQSTWPEAEFFNEAAKDYAQMVSQMSAGRLKVEMLPTASKVKTFEVLKAVSDGVIDGGHGTPGYWYEQQNALALWGEGPCFGMDSQMIMVWHQFGGGKELMQEIYESLNAKVVSFLHGPIGCQPLGWFKKDVRSAADLKGIKYRTSGIARDTFKYMDMETVVIPAGSIAEAFAADQIQGAEFANATSDSILGLHKSAQFCVTTSYHQPAQTFEALVNRSKYDALSPADKRALELAADATSQVFAWKVIDRNSQDYEALKASGIKFSKASNEILQAQLKAWDKVVEEKSKENPLFAKVYASQREFAKRAVQWKSDYFLRPDLAARHYFPS